MNNIAESILTPIAGKSLKEKTSNAVDTTFMITQVFLTFSAILLFVGAFRATDKTMRYALGLESIISGVAAYYYSIFVNRFAGNKIKWDDLAMVRYSDWYITTPIMLIVLSLILGMDLSKMKHIIAIISVIVLDYAMLHFGYLGEMGKMEKWNACLSGFLPFGLMFAIIYFVFLKPNPSNKKMVFYWFFFVLWSLYGCVYLLDNDNKNIILNCFDAVAKGGIGIGLYTEIL